MAVFQFLNKVFLRGVVGTASLTQVGEKAHLAFSVMHEYAYTDRDGLMIVDCTWFNASAFETDSLSKEEMQKVCKGAKVEVIGRLRSFRYTRDDGSPAYHLQVIVRRLHVIDDDSPESIIPDSICDEA